MSPNIILRKYPLGKIEKTQVLSATKVGAPLKLDTEFFKQRPGRIEIFQDVIIEKSLANYWI